MKNLGLANNWNKQPDVVKKCFDGAIHKPITYNLSNGLYEITCLQCGYSYMIDSSD